MPLHGLRVVVLTVGGGLRANGPGGRVGDPPGEGVQHAVLHVMQLSPELKPGHRPPAAPPPPPPRGQPGHDPEPATVFRVVAGRA